MTKRCPHCKQHLDTSTGIFSPAPQETSGWRSWCRPCENLRRKESRKVNAARHTATSFDIDVVEPAALPSSPPPLIVPAAPFASPHRPVTSVERKPTLIIGDVHAPFHSVTGLELLYQLAGDLKPQRIIQVGDLYDFLAFSRYPHNLNVMSPRDEVDEGRLVAHDMWKELGRICPDAARFQLRGNHDDRPAKRVLEVLPAIAHLAFPVIDELFKFDGVTVHQDSAEELLVDDYLVLHGYLAFGQHARRNGMHTVHGHLHHGRVDTQHDITELDVGWMGDRNAPVYGYHPQKRLHNTTLGCGWVDKYGFRFIAF